MATIFNEDAQKYHGEPREGESYPLLEWANILYGTVRDSLDNLFLESFGKDFFKGEFPQELSLTELEDIPQHVDVDRDAVIFTAPQSFVQHHTYKIENIHGHEKSLRLEGSKYAKKKEVYTTLRYDYTPYMIVSEVEFADDGVEGDHSIEFNIPIRVFRRDVYRDLFSTKEHLKKSLKDRFRQIIPSDYILNDTFFVKLSRVQLQILPSERLELGCAIGQDVGNIAIDEYPDSLVITYDIHYTDETLLHPGKSLVSEAGARFRGMAIER